MFKQIYDSENISKYSSSFIINLLVFITLTFIIKVSKKIFQKFTKSKYKYRLITKTPLITKKNPKYKLSLAKVEKLKEEGNTYLKENKFDLAYNKYTEALKINVDNVINARIYANRAWLSLKLEKNGEALDDANNAIEWDNTYVKGYYRRASANLCLCKPQAALKDFEILEKQFPNDEGLIERISKAKQLLKKQNLINGNNSSSLNEENNNYLNCSNGHALDDYSNNASGINLNLDIIIKEIELTKIDDYPPYYGPSLENFDVVDEKFVKEQIINKMKNNVFIHKKYFLQSLYKVIGLYKDKPSLIDLKIEHDENVVIVGDLHGQFYDFVNIFDKFGYPSTNTHFIFNGDFVDRGPFGVEILITLLMYKILFPNQVHLTRGNHESRNLNKFYGFENEVKAKYDNETYECVLQLFYALPLAHVINKKILILHGGLFSRDDVKLEDIRNINRFREIPDYGIMNELLWSDPSPNPGRSPSKRGVAINFGPDVANKFLDDNKLEYLIRSHEVKQGGYEVIGRVITIFSAPNYCDQMGNKGAIVKLKGNDLNPELETFSCVPHPKVPSMAFTGPWVFL